MEPFAAYSHAIMSLAVFAILGLVLGPVSAARKAGEGVEAGAMPVPDYSSATYRLSRAYMNAVELCGMFTAVTVAAILAGAIPFWVNLLTLVFLASRVAVAVVHIGGFGKANRGTRSFIFIVGWACCIALALLAIIAAY